MENHPPVASRSIVPFPRFLELIRTARFEEYKTAPGARVIDEAAFEEMKAHLTALYQGVIVQHSFLDADDQIIDCVPLAQPTPTPSPPPRSPVPGSSRTAGTRQGGTRPPTEQATISLLTENQDRLGNEMSCPEGAIPMRRITLSELTRFPRLADFFGK